MEYKEGQKLICIKNCDAAKRGEVIYFVARRDGVGNGAVIERVNGWSRSSSLDIPSHYVGKLTNEYYYITTKEVKKCFKPAEKPTKATTTLLNKPNHKSLMSILRKLAKSKAQKAFEHFELTTDCGELTTKGHNEMLQYIFDNGSFDKKDFETKLIKQYEEETK